MLFTDCGGSQPPIDPRVTMQQAPSSASAGQPALAQRLARGTGEVQYFSNNGYGGGGLLEFDFPKGESPIGSITFNGGGFCTKGARTFWATGSDEIAEFKVGGATPIRVLKTGPYSSGCAIDPATGDLAALEVFGGVTIFHKARGKGKVISGSGLAYFDGYDNQSNLFVDGFSSTYDFALVELKKGSSAFVTITTSNTVEFPGSVQWDGKYLTVTDQGADAIYRYTVSGTNATLKGTVLLSGAADCAASWIARLYVYCADAGNNDGEVFKYPAGGLPIATLEGLDFPLGVVSLRVR
ncbi:MAG: hypothetical protein WBP75_10600 [Candidatus Cybelea sp.]